MKKKNTFRRTKNIFLICVCIYAVYILAQQQVQINNYHVQAKACEEKIEYEKQVIEKLQSLQEVYKSDQFIESVARDKLGLVKPGEKVFIDASR